MAIDIGTETTTIAAAKGGKSNLRVLPYGMGEPMASMTMPEDISGIRRWLPPRISKQKVRDYLWQKSLYPGSIPADSDSLAIEQAAAREIMRYSKAELDNEFLSREFNYGTILASGSVIANAPLSTQSVLMLLDGLEPIGIISIYLDRYAILIDDGCCSPVRTCSVSAGVAILHNGRACHGHLSSQQGAVWNTNPGGDS